MILNYEIIVERQRNGETLKGIWVDMDLPVKYSTFERAVYHYKKTGGQRDIRAVADEHRPSNGTYTQLNLFESMCDDAADDMAAAMTEMAASIEKYCSEDQKAVNTLLESIVTPIEEIRVPTKVELITMLQKGTTISTIHPNLDWVFSVLANLEAEGYMIDRNMDNVKLAVNQPKESNVIVKEWDGTRHIRIGVVSDTHIGNKNTQMTFLNKLYDTYHKLGINDVYHCGDISDGWYPNRSDQIYELFALGADQQVDYIVKNYPRREGIKTHFIIGNHDYTFVRNTGLNIGEAIAYRRDDMEYLGVNNARVWLTPKCDIELNHPADGSAYAMSYSIQKYIDSMTGGDKPKILLNGHHHKYLTMFYRNIHAIEVPCVEAQTNWMKSKRLPAHIGGLILDIDVAKDGTIDRFAVEMIPLYNVKESDY